MYQVHVRLGKTRFKQKKRIVIEKADKKFCGSEIVHEQSRQGTI